MHLPLSPEQFLQVVQAYNESVWFGILLWTNKNILLLRTAQSV